MDTWVRSGLVRAKSLDEKCTHPWSQGSRVPFLSTITLSPVKREKTELVVGPTVQKYLKSKDVFNSMQQHL